MRNRLLVLVVAGAAALLSACGTGTGEELVTQDDAVPPPAVGASISLWLSAQRVPPGPVELVGVLVNHTGEEATFGVAATVDRWEDGSWVAHRQLALCMDHWHCTAEMQTSGEGLAVPGIGLSASPDRVGPVERFTTEGLEVGWYRINQEANEGIVASGVIEVVEGAQPPAPLVPVDDAAISVSPAVVAPSSAATVDLSPLVPAPSGSQSIGDIEDAVAGLSERATVQRWDGVTWEAVADVDLVPPGPQGSALHRSADLPGLTAGEYRLVRSGPEGDHVGRFWVASTSRSAAPEQPGPPVEGGEGASDDVVPSTTSLPTADTGVGIRDRVAVTLYHCGINPLDHAGRTWEVPVGAQPFDATNVPAAFTGSGTVERLSADELTYTDDSGIQLGFVPDDGVDPPPCA